ncbi:tRNA-dihydrouridine synthase B [uncultured archaeon]|nr:tRNA-dihydrouridine synthase B [uncultured archaeon]
MLPKAFLAPTFEYGNAPFRLMCQRYGAEATVVPLVNVSAVVRHADVIDALPEEKNLGLQFSGPKPDEFAEAVRLSLKQFPFIRRLDLNSGCPSTVTMRDGSGSALMRRPETIAAIVKAMKSETDLPVSVKIRIFTDKEKTIELASAIERAGADFIIVHGRTARQGYSSTADWEMIRDVKGSLSIPLVGNGDIKSAEEGRSKMKDGFCDAFMIGRAAMSNPMVFRDKTYLTYEQRRKMFLEYIGICREHGGIALKDLKLKSVQFYRGVSGVAAIRQRMMLCKTVDELISRIESER